MAEAPAEAASASAASASALELSEMSPPFDAAGVLHSLVGSARSAREQPKFQEK